jgi:NADPH-dependent stearoyl-CoA 9-desaturase
VPNHMTKSDQPTDDGPQIDRGRPRESERPTRRRETGGWSRRITA